MSIRTHLISMCLLLVLGLPGIVSAHARHLASIHMPASPNRSGFVFGGLDISLEQEKIAVDVELDDTIFGQTIISDTYKWG
jgi:hypothetical protein